MSLFDAAVQLADRVSRPRIAQAHCDVPCGIYDTAPMKIAANTVLTLTQKLEALHPPGPNGDKTAALSFEAFKDFPGYDIQPVKTVITDLDQFVIEKDRPLADYDALQGKPFWQR